MQKYIVNIFRLLLAGFNNQIAPADTNVSLVAPAGSKIIQVMHGENNKKWGQQVVMDICHLQERLAERSSCDCLAFDFRGRIELRGRRPTAVELSTLLQR